MTRRGLITNYLREAAAQAGADTAAQLVWLEAQRAALTADVSSGGQMVLQNGFQTNTSTFDAGIPPGLRLEAINAATDRLSGLGSGGGSLILARFRNLPL
jgi:hypothetical protein